MSDDKWPYATRSAPSTQACPPSLFRNSLESARDQPRSSLTATSFGLKMELWRCPCLFGRRSGMAVAGQFVHQGCCSTSGPCGGCLSWRVLTRWVWIQAEEKPHQDLMFMSILESIDSVRCRFRLQFRQALLVKLQSPTMLTDGRVERRRKKRCCSYLVHGVFSAPLPGRRSESGSSLGLAWYRMWMRQWKLGTSTPAIRFCTLPDQEPLRAIRQRRCPVSCRCDLRLMCSPCACVPSPKTLTRLPLGMPRCSFIAS